MPRIQFKCPRDLDDLEDILSKSDTCIINVAYSKDCSSVILENIYTRKMKNIILVFSSREEELDMLKMLQSDEKSRSMTLKEIYFEGSARVKGEYDENLQYAILIGCIIYKPPLPILNKNIPSVIELLTPHNSSICFWSTKSLPFFPVHSDNYYVTYVGEQSNLDKFKRNAANMSLSNDPEGNGDQAAGNLDLTVSYPTTSPLKYHDFKRSNPDNSSNEDERHSKRRKDYHLGESMNLTTGKVNLSDEFIQMQPNK